MCVLLACRYLCVARDVSVVVCWFDVRCLWFVVCCASCSSMCVFGCGLDVVRCCCCLLLLFLLLGGARCVLWLLFDV